MTDRRYGIEIEAYGVDPLTLAAELRMAGVMCRAEGYNHYTRSHWKVVSDGSIDGNLPFELVSPPLSGQAGLEEIKTVCGVLKRLGAKVNKSCGFHVHHDGEGYRVEAFRNLLGIYVRFEAVMDEYVSASRRGDSNTYCHSIARYIYESALDARTVDSMVHAEPSRYYKLNLHAYERHGTIEVRHHQGTIDYEEIANWILLTQAIIEAGMRVSRRAVAERQGERKPDHDRWHFWNLLRKVMGTTEWEGVREFYARRRVELAAVAA